MGEAETYEASINIGPGAQQQDPPSGSAAADIIVQCGIGARLVSLDDGLTVERNGEWIKRMFSPTATAVEWAWTVSATQPDDGQVRLELRPAISVVTGERVIPADVDWDTQTYSTDVTVTADLMTRIEAWFAKNWPKILAIGGLIGAALLGFVVWLRKFINAARGRDENTPAPASVAPSSPPAPVAPTGTPAPIPPPTTPPLPADAPSGAARGLVSLPRRAATRRPPRRTGSAAKKKNKNNPKPGSSPQPPPDPQP